MAFRVWILLSKIFYRLRKAKSTYLPSGSCIFRLFSSLAIISRVLGSEYPNTENNQVFF